MIRAGVFLSTWTFVGEGNPDYLRENQSHINFSKRQKAAEIMQQIQLYQSTSYNLEQSRAISDFLDNAFGREQDEGVSSHFTDFSRARADSSA